MDQQGCGNNCLVRQNTRRHGKLNLVLTLSDRCATSQITLLYQFLVLGSWQRLLTQSILVLIKEEPSPLYGGPKLKKIKQTKHD